MFLYLYVHVLCLSLFLEEIDRNSYMNDSTEIYAIEITTYYRWKNICILLIFKRVTDRLFSFQKVNFNSSRYKYQILHQSLMGFIFYTFAIYLRALFLSKITVHVLPLTFDGYALNDLMQCYMQVSSYPNKTKKGNISFFKFVDQERPFL